MRVLGVDLPRRRPEGLEAPITLVALDAAAAVETIERVASITELASTVVALVGDEPFVLGIDVPVVVPAKPGRTRPVELVVRRRLGFRLQPGGRATLASEPTGVAAETLLAALAAAGHACLPFPDRDGRRPGLAETHPGLVLKALLWESSPLAADHDPSLAGVLFRAYAAPVYRAADLPSRTGWAEQSSLVDLVLRAVGRAEGFDLQTPRRALAGAREAQEVEHAAALLDACLVAGSARRYIEAPETCLYVGEPDSGYVVLPADAAVRRLALGETASRTARLFPRTSLRRRLEPHARLRSIDLLDLPDRPQRLEATFPEPPSYEFDNVDEMLWWKHCRHLGGVAMPIEGLAEMTVALGSGGEATPLRLVRSRHRVLSFRFEPPAAWRQQMPPRDGRTYPFRVLRAVYETLPSAEAS